MRTITLQVSGRTRIFSEEELVAIVEEYEAIVALLGEHQATTKQKEEDAQTTDEQKPKWHNRQQKENGLK